MDWLYPLSGFVVGALVGLTGMGGGSLMTPLLILLFGVHPLTAVGTDLLFAATTKTAGTAIHSKMVTWMARGRTPGCRIRPRDGAHDLGPIPGAEAESDHSRYYLHVDRGDTHHCGRGDLLAPPHPRLRPGPRRQPIANPLRGSDHGGVRCSARRACIPVLRRCGRLGPGRALLLYPRLPPVRIVGSDLAHAVPLTLVAGLGHWLIGSVDWYIVGALLLGSLPGISIGSYLATRISDRFLLPALASMLVLIGLRLVAS